MLILNRVNLSLTPLTMNGECMVYNSITVLFIMALPVFYLTSLSNESLLILIVAVVILSVLIY
jgi:phosphatidylglycerophosphate synthase